MNYTRAALCSVLFLGGLIGSAQTTVIRIAPPPPVRVGVVGVAPGPGYVWIGGYQRWTGSGYVWVAGRWAPAACRCRVGATPVCPHRKHLGVS